MTDKKNESNSAGSDEELVREIAALARLDFEPGEIHGYASQMRSILDHFEDLKTVDLTGVDPTVQINPLKIPLKPDDVARGLPKDDILKLGRRARGDFISVPRIVNPEDEAASGA
jgi:aspartyl-tRNA(Asn)/glutamyl-tRNA(Gln) amidotransferase subunit C